MKVSELAKSTYEYYKSDKHLNAVQRKETKDEEILAIIKPVFEKHKSRYGYRRVQSETKSELKGVNHKRIQRIMRENGLFGKQPKHKYHSYKGDDGEYKENLLLDKIVDEQTSVVTLERNFTTTAPNQKWTTDVSMFKISAGKLYLSPIMDMFDHSIISYDISITADFNQTKQMIDSAFNQFDDLSGLIFHSDQGWQYQMKPYKKWLKDKGIQQSFSRKGNCMDNSLMENFFGLMKNEMFYGEEATFETLDDLKAAMEEYIRYYNEERISLKRKGLTPLQYRHQSLSTTI